MKCLTFTSLPEDKNFSFYLFEKRIPLPPSLHLSLQQPSLFLSLPSCLPPFFYVDSSCLFCSFLPSDHNSSNTFSLTRHALCLSPSLPLCCSLHPRAHSAPESLWSHLEDKACRLKRLGDRETQRMRRKQWKERRKPNPIVVWNREYPPTPQFIAWHLICVVESLVIYSQQVHLCTVVIWSRQQQSVCDEERQRDKMYVVNMLLQPLHANCV